MTFDVVFPVVLAVFSLVGVGALAGRTKLLSDAVATGLAGYVTRLAVPVLLFRVMVFGDLPASPPWALWIAYFAGVALVFPIAIFLMTRVFGRDAVVGVISGVAAGFANTIMVGIPLVTAAYGEEGLVALTLLLSVHLPVMMLATSILIAWAKAPDKAPNLLKATGEVARSLATNHLVMGLVIGFAVRLAGLPIEGFLANVVNQIAETAIPCALIVLGLNLNQYGVKGTILPAIALSGLKLFVMPAAVFFVSYYVVGLSALWTSVMTLTAACPTGINAYLIGSYFGTGMRIASSTITITTLAGLATLSFWIAFLANFAPI